MHILYRHVYVWNSTWCIVRTIKYCHLLLQKESGSWAGVFIGACLLGSHMVTRHCVLSERDTMVNWRRTCQRIRGCSLPRARVPAPEGPVTRDGVFEQPDGDSRDMSRKLRFLSALRSEQTDAHPIKCCPCPPRMASA